MLRVRNEKQRGSADKSVGGGDLGREERRRVVEEGIGGEGGVKTDSRERKQGEGRKN